jgi:hypothetical protein
MGFNSRAVYELLHLEVTEDRRFPCQALAVADSNCLLKWPVWLVRSPRPSDCCDQILGRRAVTACQCAMENSTLDELAGPSGGATDSAGSLSGSAAAAACLLFLRVLMA